MNEVHFPSVINEKVEVTSWHCSNVSDCHLYWCHLTIDMTQRMPSYVRSSHSPWHIPSKSLVTCDTPQLTNQRPGSVSRDQESANQRWVWPGVRVTWSQCIIRGVKYLISDQCGVWTMILCVNQGSGDSASSPWGTKDLQRKLDLYTVILKLVQPKIWSIFSPQLLLYSSPLNIYLSCYPPYILCLYVFL